MAVTWHTSEDDHLAQDTCEVGAQVRSRASLELETYIHRPIWDRAGSRVWGEQVQGPEEGKD